jgi:ABC-2 type transport system ATP-binding protein
VPSTSAASRWRRIPAVASPSRSASSETVEGPCSSSDRSNRSRVRRSAAFSPCSGLRSRFRLAVFTTSLLRNWPEAPNHPAQLPPSRTKKAAWANVSAFFARLGEGVPRLRLVSAVEVTSLAKRFGQVSAVGDVSFRAECGEITAVLGPNGAGKTTTIEICLGLQTADAGSVTILGLPPRSMPLRARVGAMPQGGSAASGIYPAARAGEVLRLHAAFHTDPLPVDPLLERLGLNLVEKTPWRRLSGGEQQRLSLGLAVVGRPEVVFLDEPTAGLDVQGRHATWELIGDLRVAGVAVVLTTHLLDEAEQLADEIVIVKAGQVIASGTPASLTRASAAGREVRFDGPPELPISDLLAVLPAGLQVTELTPGRYLVTGDVTPDTVVAVTGWCANRGFMADRLTTGARTLEDVFLALTADERRS